jgi:hypothetical protein
MVEKLVAAGTTATLASNPLASSTQSKTTVQVKPPAFWKLLRGRGAGILQDFGQRTFKWHLEEARDWTDRLATRKNPCQTMWSIPWNVLNTLDSVVIH